MSLRKRLMKARCRISFWGNERKDRSVERDVAQAKHVKKGKAGKWATNLLAGADEEYELAKSALGAVRDFHYENTLPWEHGAQALPNERFLAYAKGIGQLKGLAEQRVSDLIDVWEQRVKEAQENSPELCSTYRYPTKEELKQLCGVEIELGPLPEAGDLRLDTADEEAQKLLEEQKIRLEALADERVKEAKMELYRRLRKLLENAKRNLEVGSDGRYREEWYDNLAAFAEAAPQMNFDDDPTLAELVDKTKEELLTIPKDELNKKENRESWEERRQEAAEAVDDILSKMAGIF